MIRWYLNLQYYPTQRQQAMDEKIAYLERIPVLSSLNHEELEAVGHQTRLVEYREGHLFFMPEDPSEVMFILKQGRVQLYRMSPDGRKLIVAILQPGAIFGHMALIGQRLHNTYAQALDDCVICVWQREEVERLLVQKPETALNFIQAVGQRLSQAEERLAETTFHQVPQRLASLLLQLDVQHGETGIIEGYTHQYLADMLGTYRETATQILNTFKQDELLELGRKRITIVNREKLVGVAKNGNGGP